MPKFTVEHQTAHPSAEAYGKLKQFLSKPDELKKFDPKTECLFNDATQTCSIKGSQFKAEVTIQNSGSGSKVSILVDLPLLLTPFKGKVQEGLSKMLSRHLG
jgi:hypothetical protein